MIELKRIFPECNADTLLVELILQKGKPFHYHGINNIGKGLMNYRKNDFIIGIVDTDKFKRKDAHLECFTETVEDKLIEEDLWVKKIPNTNKHIIWIHPEFEPWIWKLATACDVNGSEYGYHSYKKFEDASKKGNVFENKDFKKFVNAVVMKNPPPIQTLRHWLGKVFDVEQL